MNERLKFIAAASVKDATFTAICLAFKISRKTGYKWVERYNELGIDGLKERRPIAEHIPHRTSEELISSIVQARKEHPSWGPKKLHSFLETKDSSKTWPAPSIIGAVLKKYGLVRPKKRRIRVVTVQAGARRSAEVMGAISSRNERDRVQGERVINGAGVRPA